MCGTAGAAADQQQQQPGQGDGAAADAGGGDGTATGPVQARALPGLTRSLTASQLVNACGWLAGSVVFGAGHSSAQLVSSRRDSCPAFLRAGRRRPGRAAAARGGHHAERRARLNAGEAAFLITAMTAPTRAAAKCARSARMMLAAHAAPLGQLALRCEHVPAL
jgi:hypothetical protein